MKEYNLTDDEAIESLLERMDSETLKAKTEEDKKIAKARLEEAQGYAKKMREEQQKKK